MSNLRETFQTWLQQRQEQVVNLETYTPEPSQCRTIPICYDDDDDEESSIPLKDIIISGLPLCVAITPVLLTEEPVDSLIMKDKHLDTIPQTESDELIKTSVEDLVHTPSESDGISEGECDLPVCNDSSPEKDEIDLLIEEFTGELALIVPIPPGIVEANLEPKEDIRFIENLMYDNSFPRPLETRKDDSETVIDSNNDYSLSDDDSYEDIIYVDASPPDSELVSLEVVEIVIPEVGGIDTDILLTIKDDILHEKFATILSDYSLSDYEALYLNDNHIEEKSSGSTTTHVDFSQYDSFIFDLSINPFPPANRSGFYHEEFAGELAHIISPSEYDHFYFKIEPELGNFTMDVVEDIFDNPTREPRVHVPNILPTHPTLHPDSYFTLSSDSLESDLVVSFPFGTKNKIFDPGIFIEVQSKRFLSRDAFSISFIRDPLFSVIDTLLPFSSKNEDKVVNTGILAAGEEQSPHLSSHRGLKALIESPMMISGGDIPILEVLFLHFYPP
ncbi:hypothetical protein Tco_1463140 [Tanacetum coccineum]